ncbi:MAG: DUF58 domain-containing protein [Candidatus Aminicenantes bacterium]|nr:DUF58 domain-containing protein [Candidatus Aminicenantes bacterium]
MISTKTKSRVTTRPTRSGLILILILFAMITASTNYGNNMAYILTFLILSLTLVTFLQTRSNLKGLEIKNVMPQPAFAGSNVRFTLEIHNRLSGLRSGIYLAPPGAKSPDDLFGPFSIGPFSGSTSEISLPAPKRGRFTLTHLILLTVYPLGIFQVHTGLKAGKSYLVYPKPAGLRPWPIPEIFSEGNGESSEVKGGDDFVGTRRYRPGESMHHVDWKAVARGGSLNIKEFSGGGSAQLWFDWSKLAGLDSESRLSQLTRWVLEADKQGTAFGLKLLDTTIAIGSGSSHTLKCLSALALFE